jgi:hypothetical protein
MTLLSLAFSALLTVNSCWHFVSSLWQTGIPLPIRFLVIVSQWQPWQTALKSDMFVSLKWLSLH